ncbi:MAG: tetratricopeptide repeat protein, partial [Bradymonadaceae bacterium]
MEDMQTARPILRFLQGSAVLAAVALVSSTVTAQSDTAEDAGVRSAGDDARFRVIERFPERKSEPDAPKQQQDLELVISDQLAEAIRHSNWARAAKLFERRIGQEKPSHDFLHGYIAWKRQQWREARKRFDATAQRWSMLDDYSSYYSAAAALKAGDAHDAVVRAARVPTTSRLFGDALAVMTEGLTRSGTITDRRRAIRVAGRYLDHFPSGDHAADMRLTLAKLHLKEQNFADAADRLFELLEHHPLSDRAEEAEKLLGEHRESLPETARQKIDDRPKTLQLARLRALYEDHANEKVIEEATNYIENWTPGSKARCQALYWIGRSYTKLRQHEEASKWYERVLDECEGMPPYERKALYVGGKSFWNAGRKQEALTWFERLWTRYDDHSYADDGMYFAARIYRELDKGETASKLLADQVERYPEGDMAADAHWLRVRAMFHQNNYDRVVEYVGGLESTGEDDMSTRGRLNYYRARALEASGRSEKARQGYVAVARDNPLTLYALLALNRIARMDGIGGGQPFCKAASTICDELADGSDGASSNGPSVPDLPERVRSDAAYRRGAALLRLGIREWARHEFDALFSHYSGNDEALLALADLLDRAGAHEIAYALP